MSAVDGREEEPVNDPLTLTSDLEQMARWVLAIPIDDPAIGFTVRTCNALQRADKRTIGDVVRMTPRDVLMTRGSGRKVYNEIKAVLAEMGLELAREEIPPMDEPVHYAKDDGLIAYVAGAPIVTVACSGDVVPVDPETFRWDDDPGGGFLTSGLLKGGRWVWQGGRHMERAEECRAVSCQDCVNSPAFAPKLDLMLMDVGIGAIRPSEAKRAAIHARFCARIGWPPAHVRSWFESALYGRRITRLKIRRDYGLMTGWELRVAIGMYARLTRQLRAEMGLELAREDKGDASKV